MTPPRRPAPTAGPTWRDVEPTPLILLTGPEDYLAARARDRVRTALKDRRGPVELSTVDAAAYAPGQLAALASPSLFDDAKLIHVSNLAAMNDDCLADGLAYVQAPDPDVVVLWEHSGGNRGKKLLDALKAAGAAVVECKPLKNDRDKTDFIVTEFRTHRRRIDPDAARALAAAVGSSTAELAAACAQLLSDGPESISFDDVEKYYGGRVEATAFKVADAALAGRAESALKLWRQALDTGVDPVPMVGALAAKLRTIAQVHGTRGGAGQLAQRIGAAPWMVERAQEESRRFSEEDLVRALRALAEADAQVKGEGRDPAERRTPGRTGARGTTEAPSLSGTGPPCGPPERRARFAGNRDQILATSLARPDFLLAALFLCRTPLLTALSSLRETTRRASWAVSLSEAPTASSTRRTSVFSSDLYALLRRRDFSLVRLRFFWDLMLATYNSLAMGAEFGQ
jgi:DNA polymerase-3 subunit delta